MKNLLIIGLVVLFTSCIPLKTAPSISDYRVVKAHKFKRKLPKCYSFVFEDHKEANAFYWFINTKYNLDHIEVENNVPITINENDYYMSFLEVEHLSKSINLAPLLFDATLTAITKFDWSSDYDLESRTGHWYIVITVNNDLEGDVLDPTALSHNSVLTYLRALKKEYFSTHNYNELLFKL